MTGGNETKMMNCYARETQEQRKWAVDKAVGIYFESEDEDKILKAAQKIFDWTIVRSYQ